MPPRPLRREEDLWSADQMWRADRPPATFRFLHRDSRCRLFPLGAIFLRTPCPEIWPRQRRAQAHAFSEANAIKLALRTTPGERRRNGDERRHGQRRSHEGKPIPNSKRDGSMPTLMLRLLQPLGCCSGTAPRGLRRSPLSLSLCITPPSHSPLPRRRGDHFEMSASWPVGSR